MTDDVRGAASWGAQRYGDPCGECGWSWSLSAAQAVEYVGNVPDEYRGLMAGGDSTKRHPDLAWSATAYICHVTDNLRIWAERVAGALFSDERHVAGYDEQLLAVARGYDAVPLAGALWSLRLAANAWVESLSQALAQDIVLVHAERGEQRAADIARNNAHDAHHHAWDIARILAS